MSRITDKIVEEMSTWWARPLERVYAAIFIDAIVVKVRDGQVANQPFYAAIGVDLDGHKDILGIWAGGTRIRGVLRETGALAVLPALCEVDRTVGGDRELPEPAGAVVDGP